MNNKGNVEICMCSIDSDFSLKLENKDENENKNFKNLKSKKFRIPLYQRPYDWEEKETRKLLEDIWNAKNSIEKHFIGNIVVEENGEYLDVIDGQQRLTTIYLISKLLGKEIFELDYEIRDEVKSFLKKLDEILKIKNELENKENVLIKSKWVIDRLTELKRKEEYKNFVDIQRMINNLIEILKFCEEKKEDYKEVNNKENFLKNLLTNIAFSITFLKNLDATKYFEVMNLRGKQLENHQVLKAKILSEIEEKERNLYSRVWDYCSKLDSYIWELIDGKNLKTNSDRSLDKFLNFVKGKEDIKNLFNTEKEEGKNSDQNKENASEINENEINIENIIENKVFFENNNETLKEEEKRYSSIVKKYSIFLLHALRIFLAKEDINGENKANKISLEDLKLIKTFEDNLLKEKENNKEKSDDKKRRIKNFLELLLKLRILFDYFIFKRVEDYKDNFEKFHLEAFEKNENGKDRNKNKLIMIELLFELTSAEEQNWLTAALGYLIRRFEEDNESNDYNQIAKEFFNFLEELDKAFMARRLQDKKDFEDIIFKVFELKNLENVSFKQFLEGKNGDCNEKVEKKSENNNGNKEREKYLVLNQGCCTPHYFFYKVEYLLWKDYIENKENRKSSVWENLEDEKYLSLIPKFKLKKLNSIEHILPKSKVESNEKLKEIIDIFGNLALITDRLNSKLSDCDFNEKKNTYLKEIEKKENIESLKLLLVFLKNYLKDNKSKKDKGNDEIEIIKNHHTEMINLLLEVFFKKYDKLFYKILCKLN